MVKPILVETGEDRVCQYLYAIERELGKRDLESCGKLADYRVKTYSDVEVLNDNNEYEKQINLEFYCRDHFDQIYRFPRVYVEFTFTKIKRKKSSAEE